MTKLLIFGIGVLIFSSLLYCISLFVAKWKGTYEEGEVCFSDEDKKRMSTFEDKKRNKILYISVSFKIVLHVFWGFWYFYLASICANVIIYIMAAVLIIWQFICIIRDIIFIHKTKNDMLNIKRQKSFYKEFFESLYKVIFYGLIFLSMIL